MMLDVVAKNADVGPATVVQVAGSRLKVRVADGDVWATSALAFPYRPAVDDVVLVIRGGVTWYVIGVLRGTGPTSLTVPGDLEIRAPHGAIALQAGKGVEIRGDEVRVSAQRLKLLADSVFESFTDATRWVKEAWQVRAGRLRTRVDGVYNLGAERIVTRARRDVKVDGDKIHLG